MICHGATGICESCDTALSWLLRWLAGLLLSGSVNGKEVGKSSPTGWSDQVLGAPNPLTFNSC